MNDPKVQLVPTFKVGEKVTSKGTGETFEVIAITPDKKLKLRGCAGLLDPTAFEKATPPAP
jgi:hypothetical protein